MAETRVTTSAGRLPLVLRSRATPAGERLTFGLFPGQSAELLDTRVEELRAAARARDVTVTRDPGRADRVVIDVIRRDALAGPALPSPLLAYAAALHDTRAESWRPSRPATPAPLTPLRRSPDDRHPAPSAGAAPATPADKTDRAHPRGRCSVARGRAAGLIVVAATQRPSSDIVPTSLRDLFAYRWALACANDASSDVILGDGYANAGYSAATIDLDGHAGVGYLLAENRRTPRLFRAAYLSRDDIRYLASVGLTLRGRTSLRPLTGGAR